MPANEPATKNDRAAARPIPVRTTWTEAEWLLPVRDSIGGWRGSAESVSTCLVGRGNRLLQHPATEPRATDNHQRYGPKHSRHDRGAVGQDRTAL